MENKSNLRSVHKETTLCARTFFQEIVSHHAIRVSATGMHAALMLRRRLCTGRACDLSRCIPKSWDDLCIWVVKMGPKSKFASLLARLSGTFCLRGTRKLMRRVVTHGASFASATAQGIESPHVGRVHEEISSRLNVQLNWNHQAFQDTLKFRRTGPEIFSDLVVHGIAIESSSQ